MKPFRFKLQAVHTLRVRQERDTMQKYAEALLQRKLAMEKVNAIGREIAAAWTELRTELAEGCAAARILRMQAFCTSLEVRRTEANVVLQGAERAVNQAMQRMLAARQQREVVDKYQEGERSRYDRELQRLEQKELDELALRCLPLASAGGATGDMMRN